MAKVIVSSGDNLLVIINDILDFSRLEAGKLKIVPEPFDMREVVEDVAALLNLKVQEKGLELLVQYQPSLGTGFVGDAGRLRQVITNLVGNAVKFTDEGHVLVKVDGRRRGEVATTTISVEDTGCGIPEQKLNAIFEEFEQVDGSAARRHDGAGLGLAITKRIVDAMGGEISVESDLGKGSLFKITLTLPIDENAVTSPVNEPTGLSGLKNDDCRRQFGQPDNSDRTAERLGDGAGSICKRRRRTRCGVEGETRRRAI